VARLMDSRRVDEDDLRLWLGEDAQQAIARRLRFRRHDGDFFADEGVDERGLADVWFADNGDETGLMFARDAVGINFMHGLSIRKAQGKASGVDICLVLC
jgi:hypothetical protein